MARRLEGARERGGLGFGAFRVLTLALALAADGRDGRDGNYGVFRGGLALGPCWAGYGIGGWFATVLRGADAAGKATEGNEGSGLPRFCRG
jgi:hypothetical protein